MSSRTQALFQRGLYRVLRLLGNGSKSQYVLPPQLSALRGQELSITPVSPMSTYIGDADDFANLFSPLIELSIPPVVTLAHMRLTPTRKLCGRCS